MPDAAEVLRAFRESTRECLKSFKWMVEPGARLQTGKNERRNGSRGNKNRCSQLFQ